MIEDLIEFIKYLTGHPERMVLFVVGMCFAGAVIVAILKATTEAFVRIGKLYVSTDPKDSRVEWPED